MALLGPDVSPARQLCTPGLAQQPAGTALSRALGAASTGVSVSSEQGRRSREVTQRPAGRTMKLHADLRVPVAVRGAAVAPVPSPMPGVCRRMLERDGDEVPCGC